MAGSAPILWRALEVQDAPAVARLHSEAIDTGFLSRLGPGFLTVLYRAVARSPYGWGHVAVGPDGLLGYVAFARDLKRLYRSVLLSAGPRLALLLAVKLVAGVSWRYAWQTWRYPRRRTAVRGGAELLAIAVAPAARRRGIARGLIERGLAQARGQGVNTVTVCVGPGRAAAEALYRHCGFAFLGNLTHHDVTNRLYRIELSG